mgnify:CR=1 FL=1
MDILLERILSLIPKKDNGKFEHGALKQFASSIGLKSGNLISDWVNGRSKSYENYVYEISVKYSVSVEWLKGETDIKNPDPQMGAGMDGITKEILDELDGLTEAELLLVKERIRKIKESRE